MGAAELKHVALFAVDVERSADPRRHNQASVAIRRALHEYLAAAFGRAGIDWASCDRRDTGDGWVVVVPARYAKRLLVHPVLDTLAHALREHNERVSEVEQVRVRVAMHDADVQVDELGVTGRPLIMLARLLDAMPLREALDAAPRSVTVAALLSERIHEDVVSQGFAGIDPDSFTRIEAHVKESRLVGWLHLPGQKRLPRAYGRWRARAAVNHEPGGLFGAEVTICKIHDAITNPTGSWILAVRGTGGVGKTTVAYEAVDRAGGAGTVSRVLWTTIRGDVSWAERSPDVPGWWMEAVAELADQLGAALGPNHRRWNDEFREALRQCDGRLLTVVDNVETTYQAAVIVDRLHRYGLVRPHKVVITSRSIVNGPMELVEQHTVRGLTEEDAVALMRHAGRDDAQMGVAPTELLLPVVRITEGNPYLLKLVAGRYLSSGLSLERIAGELTDLAARKTGLAQEVKNYLFDRSLAELELVAGADHAQALIMAFCVKRRGDEITWDELHDTSGLSAEAFDTTLRAACDLGLVQASRLNLRYSIHSLLYEYTRPISHEPT